MRLLIVGNSQAGVLKEAHSASSDLLELEPYFYVVPGGTGPYLRVHNDRLLVTMSIENFPPRIEPEGADAPLSSFDAIVVSALGYADGGFRFQNPITAAANVPDFRPFESRNLVSASAFAQIVNAGLGGQRGFLFLESLRASYSGPIILQPFPRPSAALQDHPNWGLKCQYSDFVGMHRLIERARTDYLGLRARQLDLSLLPFPFDDPLWTPSEFMRSGDLIHAGPAYGAIVLSQISAVLRTLGLS